jgi:hypothetical protein
VRNNYTLFCKQAFALAGPPFHDKSQFFHPSVHITHTPTTTIFYELLVIFSATYHTAPVQNCPFSVKWHLYTKKCMENSKNEK